MSDTTKRIIAGTVIALIVAVAAVGEYFGLSTIRYLGVAVVLGMIAETILCMWRAPRDILYAHKWSFTAFLAWMFVMLIAVWAVAARPWIILLMLMIICAADIGGWLFGKLIGGDKMWERMSAGKTWAGQIAGIICGTLASVMYGLLGADAFMPQLMWIGISVALMSQYGDLTASYIKRSLGIKDFGKIIPGHGGILDRFDGWIYVLPLIWLVML